MIEKTQVCLEHAPAFLGSSGVVALVRALGELSKGTVVAICGPSCSGKSTLAKHLAQSGLGRVLPMDAFFKPIPEIPDYMPAIPAFDSPEALDLPLLKAGLIELRKGNSVRIPIYHYSRTVTGRDEREDVLFVPDGITFLDGILSFDLSLSGLVDFAVYVDRDAAARRAGRLRRDVEERGVDLARAIEIYDKMAVPLFRRYGEQQRERAHRVIFNH